MRKGSFYERTCKKMGWAAARSLPAGNQDCLAEPLLHGFGFCGRAKGWLAERSARALSAGYHWGGGAESGAGGGEVGGGAEGQVVAGALLLWRSGTALLAACDAIQGSEEHTSEL